MAHLFNTIDYRDYRIKLHSNFRKLNDAKIDQLLQTTNIPLHPIQLTEDVVHDNNTFQFSYEGETITLPNKLLEVQNLSEIVNMKVIQQEFDQQQIKQLLELVPQKSLQNVKQCLEGSNLVQTNIRDFQKKMRSGYFTVIREKEEEITAKLSEYRLKEIYQGLLKTIMNQRTASIKTQKFAIEQEEQSVQSINDLSSVEEMSENSQNTETEQQHQDYLDDQFAQRVFFRYDPSKIKGQEELLALGEDKIDKKTAMYKITLPARPRNNEWVQNYRKQEFQRYSNPTKPWTYSCEDGRKATVAPVAKKLSVLTGKPRDHPLLKSERPACVTILTLVRDAAARLHNGVGTRAEISQLLKESQYVNEDLPEQKLSNIVSGALDRLHYMTDACVKYDSEKKLWIYLHSDRNYEHPNWGEDGDDYMEKYPSKKKKRDFQ